MLQKTAPGPRHFPDKSSQTASHIITTLKLGGEGEATPETHKLIRRSIPTQLLLSGAFANFCPGTVWFTMFFFNLLAQTNWQTGQGDTLTPRFFPALRCLALPSYPTFANKLR